MVDSHWVYNGSVMVTIASLARYQQAEGMPHGIPTSLISDYWVKLEI
jgi:hypothetical protein